MAGPHRRAAPALVLLALVSCADKDLATEVDPEDAGEATPIVASCPTPAPPSSGEVNIELDIPYTAPADASRRLDIAWPKTAGPHPLVVLLHGGGWAAGNKTDLRSEMRILAGQGYAAASVGYRLAFGARNIFPAAVADARCAVRWLRSNAGSYGIDGTRVAAAGYSAGAHLASMLGTASDVAGLDDGCSASGPVDVSAVVSFAGPQDLRVNGPYTNEQALLVTNFLGVFPGDAPAIATLASPLAHVGAGDAPFLMVHGALDPLVPIDQSRRMKAALRASGVKATLLERAGAGHEFVSLASTSAPEVGCTVLNFLDSVLQP